MNRNFRRAGAFLCCLQLLCTAFLLQLRKGHVCWYDSARDIWTQTGVSADMLPQPDRARLTEGLSFDTRAQLSRALEDYCS